MRRNPVLALLILCVLLMAYVTAYPFRFSTVGSQFLLFEFPHGRASWLDVWLNVLFFAPFGILCGLRIPGMKGMVVCGLTSLLFSSGIEWMQMYIPGRCASLMDIAMNGLGGTIGALVANRKILRAASLAEWLKNEIPGDRVGILIGLWVIANWSPFIPLLKIYAFTNQLKAAFRFDLSWTKLLEILVGSFAVVFLFAENLGPSRARRASLILIGLLPIQLVLWDRPKPLSEILICTLAMVLAIWWLERAGPIAGKELAIAALALIAIRELNPFRWEPQIVGQFLWIPLKGTLESPRVHALPVFAEKCFFYWYFLHQANRSFGTPLIRLALALSAFVGLAEVGQRYQTGRVPEIADPLLCLLGAVVLHLSAKSDQGLKRAAK